MTILCARSPLNGTCGTGLFYGFYRSNRPDYYRSPLTSTSNRGGAGWAIAGFINDDVRKEAYNILKRRFQIVLQTPTRRNSNSGNQFFMVVYDTKGLKKPRWTGKNKGAPKPQALLDWEANPVALVDNLQHNWPFQ